MKKTLLLIVISLVFTPYLSPAQPVADSMIVLSEEIAGGHSTVTHSRETISPVNTNSGEATQDRKVASTSQMAGFSGTNTTSASSTVAVDAGRMAGNLEVSQTGSATYTLPIAVPPGLSGVAPQIALTYSSQGGNGIAGWGWNVSGLSSITRIPPSLHHNNYVAAVSLSTGDCFALDGQRLLLKSGVYGRNGAEYQTENYSTIRIVSRGGLATDGSSNSPMQFEVYYPDGTKAYYGTSTTPGNSTEFVLAYSENALGARVTYTYVTSSSLQYISKIEYGSKGSASAINSINFEYKTPLRPEQGYIAGRIHYRDKLLSKITVLANGTNYRSYVFEHEATMPLKYERLRSISEYNADQSKQLSPIRFNYNTTSQNAEYNTVSDFFISGINGDKASVLTGDFTGEGQMDFILYPKTKNKIYPFWNPGPNSFFGELGEPINTGSFSEILQVNSLASDNKMNKGQGFVLVKWGYNDITFEVWTGGHGISPVHLEYTKSWEDTRTANGYSACNPEEYSYSTAIGKHYYPATLTATGCQTSWRLQIPIW